MVGTLVTASVLGTAAKAKAGGLISGTPTHAGTATSGMSVGVAMFRHVARTAGMLTMTTTIPQAVDVDMIGHGGAPILDHLIILMLMILSR